MVVHHIPLLLYEGIKFYFPQKLRKLYCIFLFAISVLALCSTKYSDDGENENFAIKSALS